MRVKCNIKDILDLKGHISIWDDILTKDISLIDVSKPSLKSVKNYKNMWDRKQDGVVNFNKLTYCYLENYTLYIFGRRQLNDKFSMIIFKSSHWKLIKENMNI